MRKAEGIAHTAKAISAPKGLQKSPCPMEIGYGRLLGGGRGGGGKEVAGAKRPLFLADGTRNTLDVFFNDCVQNCVPW